MWILMVENPQILQKIRNMLSRQRTTNSTYILQNQYLETRVKSRSTASQTTPMATDTPPECIPPTTSNTALDKNLNLAGHCHGHYCGQRFIRPYKIWTWILLWTWTWIDLSLFNHLAMSLYMWIFFNNPFFKMLNIIFNRQFQLSTNFLLRQERRNISL
jgi:hypothetical protein